MQFQTRVGPQPMPLHTMDGSVTWQVPAYSSAPYAAIQHGPASSNAQWIQKVNAAHQNRSSGYVATSPQFVIPSTVVKPTASFMPRARPFQQASTMPAPAAMQRPPNLHYSVPQQAPRHMPYAPPPNRPTVQQESAHSRSSYITHQPQFLHLSPMSAAPLQHHPPAYPAVGPVQPPQTASAHWTLGPPPQSMMQKPPGQPIHQQGRFTPIWTPPIDRVNTMQMHPGASSYTHPQMSVANDHQVQPPYLGPMPSMMQSQVRPVAAPLGGAVADNLEYIVAPSSARGVREKSLNQANMVSHPETRMTVKSIEKSASHDPRGNSQTMATRGAVAIDTRPPPELLKSTAVEEPDNSENPESFVPLGVGDRLPPAHIDLHGACVNLQEFFEDRSGIIFGVVGAFNPVDTDHSVPKILECMESFERLVDFVGCLVVNDPFVVRAWARKLNVTDQFTFIADADAKFTKVLGMAQFLPEEGLGLRCRRFAAVIGNHAKIRWIGFNEDADANNVLLHLPRFVRTPWKSFLVGIGYTDPDFDDAETLAYEGHVKESTVNNLQNMRRLLASQGFCSESDWQLLLCDKMGDVFAPTRDNMLNGMQWLVEGAQAGDVLCFYFAGKGGRFVNAQGVESVGILPVDHETAGPIDEWTLYDILAPVFTIRVLPASISQSVPACCRITIILDVQNEEVVTCPLPYVYKSEVSVVPSGYMEAQIVSGTNEQWAKRFTRNETLRGEILVISLTGGDEVDHGSLSTLLNAVCLSPDANGTDGPADQTTDVEATPLRAAEAPLSYADQMDRMQVQLVEWGTEKSVQISSSRPLNLVEEFSLADVLPTL